ncbi:PIG-L deacetylase family protein [Fodinicola acaciae]|uniref:PIG-L deacetylase family protein n=1 Tax=Fodinicola acaciae TaxID=2681555 RepID=UPI0013D39148|nr:PIG-L deacetylase family protein [Fodinicola acaciae]
MSYPKSAEPSADVRRVLAIAAHPDDIDFGAAGTIARWTKAGVEVTYCLVTRGDSGGFDDTPRDRMPAIREAEQRAAAAAVGVTDVRFLDGYVDGAVYVTHELRRDLTRVIRQVRPQRVVAPAIERDYSRLGTTHPDHKAVGEAAFAAIYPDARNPFAHPELGLPPWTVSELWLMDAPNPDFVVDITDTLDAKIAALRSHVSQLPDPDAMEARVRERAAILGSDRAAETFVVLRTR